MSGTINLHRDAFDHPILKDGERFRAWFWMVSRACWKPTRFDVAGRIITLERGQFCCSVRELAEAWGWSKSAVDRFLTRLKTETMIGTDAGTGKLVVTIRNYDKYQSQPNATGTANGTPTGTAAGQQRDIKEEGQEYIEPSVLANSRSTDGQGGVGEDIPARPKITKADIDTAIEQWTVSASKRGWPVPRALTDARRKKLAARLRTHGTDGWKLALTKAWHSPLLSADPPPSWFNFDWITKNDENLLKVLEGNYDRGRDDPGGLFGHNGAASPKPRRQYSPDELAAARQRLAEREGIHIPATATGAPQ